MKVVSDIGIAIPFLIPFTVFSIIGWGTSLLYFLIDDCGNTPISPPQMLQFL